MSLGKKNKSLRLVLRLLSFLSQYSLLSLSSPLPLHSVDAVVVAKDGSQDLRISLIIQLTPIPRFTQIQTIILVGWCNAVGIIWNISSLHIHATTNGIPSTVSCCVHLSLDMPEIIRSVYTVWHPDLVICTQDGQPVGTL